MPQRPEPQQHDPGALVRATGDAMLTPAILWILGVAGGFSGRLLSTPSAPFDWAIALAFWGGSVLSLAPTLLAIWTANRQITIIDNLTERHGGPESITIRAPEAGGDPKKHDLWGDVSV